MLIIGLTGLRGSGKSTVAKILIQGFRFPVIRLGDKVRSTLQSGNLGNTFHEILKLSLTLQKELASGSVGELFLNEIQEYINIGAEAIVLDSVRTIFDENFFKKLSYNFIMIGVSASDEERYRRIKVRKRIDDSPIWETFLENEEREIQLLGYNRLSVPDFCIDTTGMEINQMQKAIEKTMFKIKKKSLWKKQL